MNILCYNDQQILNNYFYNKAQLVGGSDARLRALRLVFFGSVAKSQFMKTLRINLAAMPIQTILKSINH
ncbi:MAG TPA: hypothetical protein DCL66_14775 [Gammaproteobacteria bacterium]|nr:hypothetical protein [Gammaproteobacteria bacterium]